MVMALATLIACGDNDPGIVVDDTLPEPAFQIESNRVAMQLTLVKDQQRTLQIVVVGNANAFPGLDQIPVAGDLFVGVADPTTLGGGALAGELPGPQAYRLSNVFLPALVSYAWYVEDAACNPGCMRSAAITMALVDDGFGGTAPAQVTVKVDFRATLRGWDVDLDSPKTDAPSITLSVGP